MGMGMAYPPHPGWNLSATYRPGGGGTSAHKRRGMGGLTRDYLIVAAPMAHISLPFFLAKWGMGGYSEPAINPQPEVEGYVTS